MATEKVILDGHELHTLQSTTPSTVVPFGDPPRARPQTTQAEHKSLEERENMAQSTRSFSADQGVGGRAYTQDTSETIPNARQRENKAIHKVTAPLTPRDSRARDLGDAAAANWGSHMRIEIGSLDSHVALEVGIDDCNRKKYMEDDNEPLYTSVKE